MMTFSRVRVFLIGAIMIVAGMLAWWGFGSQQKILLPIAPKDAIVSWNFVGAYADNPELQAKAQTEIERLTRLVGNSEEFTDYQLYVSIAAYYELLGDGAQAYAFFNKALNIDSSQTGLAWANSGELMERLGAFHTGRIAYAKAVEAQPLMNYHLSRLTFLTQHFENDMGAIEGAFSEAKTQFGDIPQILQIKAGWLTEIEKFEDAISVWKQMRALVTDDMRSSIDKEIRRLEAKI